ncbi:hypothetical protein [Glycomyces tritici]|uniref:CopG family transcriptional regulator n=1 Tax=Glycomyces tritici TaxID=2665176 RepID=A0ABT7YWL3_9ACTN|nr:hypothetical protein [Glycomyces tritici]MDN3243027.1 hypothetical protein [Glycomyces tritici]
MSSDESTQEANVTLPLTSAELDRIRAAAQDAGQTPEQWMARVLRTESRRAQIAAYEGPDSHTQARMAAADHETEAMLTEAAMRDER